MLKITVELFQPSPGGHSTVFLTRKIYHNLASFFPLIHIDVHIFLHNALNASFIPALENDIAVQKDNVDLIFKFIYLFSHTGILIRTRVLY